VVSAAIGITLLVAFLPKTAHPLP